MTTRPYEGFAALKQGQTQSLSVPLDPIFVSVPRESFIATRDERRSFIATRDERRSFIATRDERRSFIATRDERRSSFFNLSDKLWHRIHR